MTKSRKAAFGGAAAGALAGVVGLVLLTSPAGAGQAPALQETTPEELVASVLKAKPAAFGGTVTADNNLGLPAVPGVPQLPDGDDAVRLWSDGTGKGRVSLPSAEQEETVVHTGKTVWTYDSGERKAVRVDLGDAGHRTGQGMLGQEAMANPMAMVKPMLDEMRKTSEISVDGTAEVAGRDAYELVLTPKPTERTLLRQVRVAVDEELRMPLSLDVHSYGSTEPALHVGFSDLEVGAQDPALFRFTPPKGTTVETVDAEKNARELASKDATDMPMDVLGDGWDSVLVTEMSPEFLGKGPREGAEGDGGGQNPTELLRQFGKPVSGAWGDGYLVRTAVANAIITSDGRLAAGFVPEQVLSEALEEQK